MMQALKEKFDLRTYFGYVIAQVDIVFEEDLLVSC